MYRHALRFGQACVATPHHLASAAGLEVLATGGNALDAAVAANLTLGVVAPHLCGFGGDLFAQVWDGREAHAYHGGGRAPHAASLDAVRERVDGDTMPRRGAVTVTVPGAVQGWFDLLERFGTRGFVDLASRARAYAREGVPLSARGRLVMEFLIDDYRDFPDFLAVYGHAADRGLLEQPDLARTIEALGSGGPEAYYRGEVARAMATYVEQQGGLLSVDDLAGHHGEWVTPLRASWEGVDVLELPPPTQGATALQVLKIVEAAGDLPPEGPDRQHLLIEAMKLALADRDAYVTDPDDMAVEVDELLSDTWVGDRAGRIDREHARDPGPATEIPGGTAYLCAADPDGMSVSLIQTNFNEFGSGLTVPGWGINLQNRGRAFSLDPAHVNVVAPGKRTLHTLIPALALRAARPWLVLGTMGADAQAQVHLQLLTRIVHDGLDLQEAIDAPRWRVEPGTWKVLIETRFGDEVLDGLADRGHELAPVGAWFDYMGYAQAIAVEPWGYSGATDPRSEGSVVGF